MEGTSDTTRTELSGHTITERRGRMGYYRAFVVGTDKVFDTLADAQRFIRDNLPPVNLAAFVVAWCERNGVRMDSGIFAEAFPDGEEPPPIVAVCVTRLIDAATRCELWLPDAVDYLATIKAQGFEVIRPSWTRPALYDNERKLNERLATMRRFGDWVAWRASSPAGLVLTHDEPQELARMVFDCLTEYEKIPTITFAESGLASAAVLETELPSVESMAAAPSVETEPARYVIGNEERWRTMAFDHDHGGFYVPEDAEIVIAWLRGCGAYVTLEDSGDLFRLYSDAAETYFWPNTPADWESVAVNLADVARRLTAAG